LVGIGRGDRGESQLRPALEVLICTISEAHVCVLPLLVDTRAGEKGTEEVKSVPKDTRLRRGNAFPRCFATKTENAIQHR
jgi:hypothetical protein